MGGGRESCPSEGAPTLGSPIQAHNKNTKISGANISPPKMIMEELIPGKIQENGNWGVCIYAHPSRSGGHTGSAWGCCGKEASLPNVQAPIQAGREKQLPARPISWLVKQAAVDTQPCCDLEESLNLCTAKEAWT